MPDVDEQYDDLMKAIKKALAGKLPKAVQDELANVIPLLPVLNQANASDLLSIADLAVAALIKPDPEVNLAESVIKDLQQRASAMRNPWRAAFFSHAPGVRVVWGLALLLYFALPILIVVFSRWALPPTLAGIDSGLLVLVGAAGAIGSIVSIMVRLPDFSRPKVADPGLLLLTGFFKPIIGTAFALFVFLAISAGIIPITVDPPKQSFFFGALAFVSGFSERFARDVATSTEKAVLTPQGKGEA